MFGNEREGRRREKEEKGEGRSVGKREENPRNREGEEEDESRENGFHERPPKRI